MKTLVKNARIVTSSEILEGANLLYSESGIEYIGKDTPFSETVIDADGRYLIPGFIDLHCHGGDGYEFMDATPDEMAHIAAFHLSHGTTTMLATTLAAPDREICACLDNIARILDTGTAPSIIGAHLEGPWFEPEQCGAQNPEYIRCARSGELNELYLKYNLFYLTLKI